MSILRPVFILFEGMTIGTDPVTGRQFIDGGSSNLDYTELMNLFLSTVNFTIIGCKNLAKDCLDILSRQEGDVLLARTGLETLPADQSVLPFQAFDMDGYYIISPYNCTLEKALEDSVAGDITDAYRDAFSLPVWFTSGVTTVILMVVFSAIFMVESLRDRLFNAHSLARDRVFSTNKLGRDCIQRTKEEAKSKGLSPDHNHDDWPMSRGGVIKREVIKEKMIGEKLISRKLISGKLTKRDLITKSIWITISSILLNPKDVNSKFYIVRMFQLLIAIFVFFVIISYFMNAIITDRMKMKEQKVYRSYADIMNDVRDGIDIIIMTVGQSDEFIDSLLLDPKSPVRDSLYKYIKNPNTKMIRESKDMVTKLVGPKYDYVLINGKLTTKIFQIYACTLMTVPSGKRAPDTCLYRIEESTYDWRRVNGALASKTFLNHPLYGEMKQRSTKLFEAGFLDGPQITGFKEMTPESSRFDCLSESVNLITHDPGKQSMDISFFLRGFITLIAFLIIPLIVLIIELIINCLKEKSDWIFVVRE